MHPLLKYALIFSVFAFLHLPSQSDLIIASVGTTFASEDTITFYSLKNEETSLSALTQNQPLFIAILNDIESPDEPLRFITLVESSEVSDRTQSIICIPLKTTSYVNRKSKLALINRYIKGDYMRSKLYLADAQTLNQLLQNHSYGLLNETAPIWLSHYCPKNEETLIREIVHHPLFSEEKNRPITVTTRVPPENY